MLSKTEHLYLNRHFMVNIVPVLVIEVLGNLSKQFKSGSPPEHKVKELAYKFGGSGGIVNLPFREMCKVNLAGQDVPMEGKVIPDNSEYSRASDGSLGVVIEPSDFNMSIMRWASGVFSEQDRELATQWRKKSRTVSFHDFKEQLRSSKVQIPKTNSLEDAAKVTEELLSNPEYQQVWLLWILETLDLDQNLRSYIIDRWLNRGGILFSDFAPYANFCVKANLLMLVAVRNNIVGWKPTHFLDMQYLYYLPFCMAFVSEDNLHRRLVPYLLRENQTYVLGSELKKDLRRLDDLWNSFDDKVDNLLRYSLGSRPIPAKESIVHDLWEKHCTSWSPGSGNRAMNLTDEEKKVADELAQSYFDNLHNI